MRPAGGRRHDGQGEARYAAVAIVVKRSEGLTVTFADEHGAKIDLMQLRLACPCATCRSLRERGEAAWPRHGSPTRRGRAARSTNRLRHRSAYSRQWWQRLWEWPRNGAECRAVNDHAIESADLRRSTFAT